MFEINQVEKVRRKTINKNRIYKLKKLFNKRIIKQLF